MLLAERVHHGFLDADRTIALGLLIRVVLVIASPEAMLTTEVFSASGPEWGYCTRSPFMMRTTVGLSVGDARSGGRPLACALFPAGWMDAGGLIHCRPSGPSSRPSASRRAAELRPGVASFGLLSVLFVVRNVRSLWSIGSRSAGRRAPLAVIQALGRSASASSIPGRDEARGWRGDGPVLLHDAPSGCAGFRQRCSGVKDHQLLHHRPLLAGRCPTHCVLPSTGR